MGFEPTDGLHRQRFSRPADFRSTASVPAPARELARQRSSSTPVRPSSLSLVRTAAVTFKPPPAAGNHFSADVGSASIRTVGRGDSGNEALSVIFAAEIPLRYQPKVTSDNFVVVPGRERALLEAGLETVANMIAATNSCARSMFCAFHSRRRASAIAEGLAELEAVEIAVAFPRDLIPLPQEDLTAEAAAGPRRVSSSDHRRPPAGRIGDTRK